LVNYSRDDLKKIIKKLKGVTTFIIIKWFINFALIILGIFVICTDLSETEIFSTEGYIATYIVIGNNVLIVLLNTY
jgi:hypothetical protein